MSNEASGQARAAAQVPEKLPPFTKAQLEALVAEFPTPFHLYDEATIRTTAEAVRAAFAWNAGFQEFFAVKAAPTPALIRILAEYGCGVDCATGTELLLAERCGFSGASIMFSSNVTPAEDFAEAARLGATVNFDDPAHVGFYLRTVGHAPARASVRVNPGGQFEGANGIFDAPQDSKFGMTPEQAIAAVCELAEAGVQEIGLHALLCSNTLGTGYYPRLARLLFELAVRIARETGTRIAFVNLSGGVGISYRPEDPMPSIAEIGAGVRAAYEEVIVPSELDGLALYTELGRYMTGPAGFLITRVLHSKTTYHRYLGVDASMADLMRPAMYGAYHHITNFGPAGGPDKSRMPAELEYDVVGGLSENNDRFANARALPASEPGDLLVVHDTGAHGRSMGFQYNGKLRHAEVLLRCDGSAQLIRRAETPQDYFATLDGFWD